MHCVPGNLIGLEGVWRYRCMPVNFLKFMGAQSNQLDACAELKKHHLALCVFQTGNDVYTLLAALKDKSSHARKMKLLNKRRTIPAEEFFALISYTRRENMMDYSLTVGHYFLFGSKPHCNNRILLILLMRRQICWRIAV